MEIGGGVRNFESIKKYIDAGVEKTILGSAAIKDKNFLNRLRMGINVRTGEVNYTGYTDARPVKGKVFTDLELAQHAIKKAKAGELFTADHIIPKALNMSTKQRVENYVYNNPGEKKKIKNLDEYFKKNKLTYSVFFECEIDTSIAPLISLQKFKSSPKNVPLKKLLLMAPFSFIKFT